MTDSVCSHLRGFCTLNVLLLTLTGVSLSGPIRLPESHHREPVGRDEGDYTLLDAQDFLSHFLFTMNLTELRSQPKHLTARREPPEYMLELYKRFSQDYTEMPSANVVRSFKNEGTPLLLFTCGKKSQRNVRVAIKI